MKITQLRGDLAAFRNLELSIVLNAMKTENSRKPVTTLRQNIPYLTPGIKSLAAEKIPVVLFGVTLKRDDERIGVDRKSTRLNSSHKVQSRMPSSA